MGRELWDRSKPIPTSDQPPQIDCDLYVEDAFSILRSLKPTEIFDTCIHCGLNAIWQELSNAAKDNPDAGVKLKTLMDKLDSIPKAANNVDNYINFLDDICASITDIEEVIFRSMSAENFDLL